MTTGNRPIFTDGVAPFVEDWNQIALGLDAFLQQLLQHLLGDSEQLGGSDGFFGPTVPNDAVDAGSATLPTYGFLGPSLRVRRVDATHIRLAPGLGLQYVTDGYPAGEWPLRVVRLDGAAPEVTSIDLASVLPSSGNFRRVLVCAQWRDVAPSAARAYIDPDGNAQAQTVTIRTRPEVGALDGYLSGIRLEAGTPAGSAAAATRPSIPSGYVQLAELLLSSTGLAQSSNPDGNTSGITDLRPRIRPSKAGGAVDSRRATCSMNETQIGSTVRFGAKAVGAELVFGVVSVPTSVGVVTLDTSRDWRDMMVTIDHTALMAAALLPGGGSDASLSYGTTPGEVSSVTPDVGLGRVVFYSGLGSAAGMADYFSWPSKTPADGADTRLIFFADSTTGHLKCRGIAHASGTQHFYFEAKAVGPLSRRVVTGQES